MTQSGFEGKLRAALRLEMPYSSRVGDGLASVFGRAVRAPRAAAVLILVGHDGDHDVAAPRILITRRAERLMSHRGQMAFPGGMADPDDAAEVATALRETREEVGIPAERVNVLGQLPALTTLSTGFLVTPVVGMLREPVSRIELAPNPDEIAEAFWIDLARLEAEGVYRREWFKAGPVRLPTHVYRIGPYRIWGATAAMLKNLMDRLNAVSGL